MLGNDADENHHHKQEGIAAICTGHPHINIFFVCKTTAQKHHKCSCNPYQCLIASIVSHKIKTIARRQWFMLSPCLDQFCVDEHLSPANKKDCGERAE